MKFPENNIIDNWLSQNGAPLIGRLIRKNLAIADKVQAILASRKISRIEFAEMLGEKPFKVSKWLSGQHNLSIRNIVRMEIALGRELIDIEPVEQPNKFYQ